MMGRLLLLLGALIAGAAVPPPAGAYAVPADDSVRIGLIVPGAGEGVAAGRAALHGARLALDAANRAGGYRGRPFALRVRYDAGAWGTGAQEVVRLVFDDEVRAVVGGLGGRAAHVVEQAIVKRRLAFVTPWASDATLAQANIPWFFRMVPDDDRQAEALVEAVFVRRGLREVVTVADDSYEAKLAEGAFVGAARAAGGRVASRLAFAAGHPSSAPVVERLAEAPPEAVVLFAAPHRAALVVRQLRARGVGAPVHGPHFLSGPSFTEAAAAAGNVFVVAPEDRSEARARAFSDAYRSTHGEPPPAVAAYTYDAVETVVRAIHAAGLDRAAIRDALAGSDHDGVTGPVRFDARGNRDAAVVVRPVTAE